ncbi:MAG: response regulator [Deltaproteobacteria bacterium]|nr:response regulator [Deltaproteobacteria bacterium]MBW1960728.1 response regulator [Deltaproteobacteria bacterium]MBW2152600.1 response regulator [Deltaproteobacteria bacterium]
MTLLVVDDEPDIRDALHLYLSYLGYEVLTAKDGQSALEIFQQNNPPIVLSDIKMPGMDGIELLQKIKQQNPDTEVIMITGHGDMDRAVRCLQLDATDFITKPINDDALEIALKRAKDKMNMRHQLREYTENLEKLVEEKSAKLVEAERLAAVGQAVLGLSSAMRDIAGSIQYFNEMPCFVSIHNRHLKVVSANQLYRDRLGNDVGGDSWAIYKGIADGKKPCPVEMTFQSGKGVRSEQRLVYSDGRELPVMVHTAPIRNRDGALELVLEITADISEVQRLQEQLRITQRRYQQLFDEAPCYISVQDADFRITAINRRFKEDFGDATGSLCYETYKQRSAPCENCPAVKTFEDGKSHQMEMVVTSKSGEQYHVLTWTAPILNATGEIAQVMEMSTNITQIRKLQDHLTTLGLLIGSISHGVKGILTGMDSGVYLLDSGFSRNDSKRIEEGIEVVKLMVDRIRNLVLNVLYYAKRRELNWQRVDVLKFVSDVAFIIEPKVKKHRIELVRDFHKPLGQFEIDVGVVRSALVNILENAVEACLEDNMKKSHKIIFRAKQHRHHIELNISDNGIGMDKETEQNIFNLFFSSKGQSGTGLGLYISNQVIEQHGGKITVSSEPGKGADFCIRLPKVLPEDVKSIQTESEMESIGSL